MSLEPFTSISTYLRTVQAYDDATLKLSVLARGIGEIADRLLEPVKALTEENGSIAAQDRLVDFERRVFHPANWASGQQIADAVRGWQEAHRALRKAWGAIPQQAQKGLVPPDGLRPAIDGRA
jgi:hypothetical protein